MRDFPFPGLTVLVLEEPLGSSKLFLRVSRNSVATITKKVPRLENCQMTL
jgi:hypothetical protein